MRIFKFSRRVCWLRELVGTHKVYTDVHDLSAAHVGLAGIFFSKYLGDTC